MHCAANPRRNWLRVSDRGSSAEKFHDAYLAARCGHQNVRSKPESIIRYTKEFAAGFGARLTAPNGGDTLGTGKWQIMPVAGFRYGLSEISSGSFLEPSRYAVSFAGDPSKRNISNLQLAPYLNLGLPDHWFIALYLSVDIRVNFGDPVTGQTGRLFLPFDARIGRNLTDHLALSLEVGVPIIKDYPVYNVKAEVRLNFTY
jgi:hypothetical protein